MDLDARMGGIVQDGGRREKVARAEMKKNRKKVLPQAACNQFDSIPNHAGEKCIASFHLQSHLLNTKSTFFKK